MAPDAGTAGIHDDGKRLLDRLWLVKAALDVEIAAVVVELVLRRPKQLQHVQPFGCVGIALVMFHDRGAKHLQLGREPAADDVQGKTAAGDVVDRRRLLGGDDRMKGRHMRGREHRRVIRGAADTGGPGEGFKTSAVEIGDAAEAAPARNRDERLEARVVGHAGQPLDVVPGGMEHAVDRGDRAGVVHVQAEQSELEAIVAVQSVRVTHENSRSSSRRMLRGLGPAVKRRHRRCRPPAGLIMARHVLILGHQAVITDHLSFAGEALAFFVQNCRGCWRHCPIMADARCRHRCS